MKKPETYRSTAALLFPELSRHASDGSASASESPAHPIRRIAERWIAGLLVAVAAGGAALYVSQAGRASGTQAAAGQTTEPVANAPTPYLPEHFDERSLPDVPEPGQFGLQHGE